MLMEMENVESSLIKSVGYRGGTMYILFHDGKMFEYRGVPAYIHRDLMRTASHGGYFQKHIEGRFGEIEVDHNGG